MFLNCALCLSIRLPDLKIQRLCSIAIAKLANMERYMKCQHFLLWNYDEYYKTQLHIQYTDYRHILIVELYCKFGEY